MRKAETFTITHTRTECLEALILISCWNEFFITTLTANNESSAHTPHLNEVKEQEEVEKKEKEEE